MFNTRRLLYGGVCDNLCSNGLSTSSALVGRDEYPRSTIVHPITEGLGGEAGENNGVDSADTSAGKECSHGVPCHGKVDRDGIALLDTETLEDICDLANLRKELRIGNFPAFIGLISLVDDGGLRSIMT